MLCPFCPNRLYIHDGPSTTTIIIIIITLLIKKGKKNYIKILKNLDDNTVHWPLIEPTIQQKSAGAQPWVPAGETSHEMNENRMKKWLDEWNSPARLTEETEAVWKCVN